MDIHTIVAVLHSNFKTGFTRSLAYRLQQLSGINRFIDECEQDIEQALYQDLKKPALESYSAELAIVKSELNFIKKHLSSWMKPQSVSTNLAMQPGKSRIYTEPRGVALIIGPWNYPFQLVISPLIGALAAGNCVVIKPSEIAPATSRLLATFLPKYLDNQCVQIVEGGIPESTALLAEPFDYIFYTGNTSVGKIVMQAAAKRLTPITLELGGKCPCIVDKTTNLNVAARRIVWGKFSNAGQTCVAPDYILVHKDIEESLLNRIQAVLIEFYSNDPKISPNYGRIINKQHHQRLMKLLADSDDIFIGGDADENDCYIAPTILRNISKESSAMDDEIFGPILPILTIQNIDEAISYINKKPKPLAIYVFSSNKEVQQEIINRTSSGGICINHTMVHLAVPELPFGGIGASGMGAYHGKASFDTFSHRKSVFTKSTWFDITLLYPPYKPALKKLLRWVM